MKDFDLNSYLIQFSIFNDIAQALNLSFDIQPSSDGGKWGMVKRNDTDFTVTGIYGDLKVITYGPDHLESKISIILDKKNLKSLVIYFLDFFFL